MSPGSGSPNVSEPEPFAHTELEDASIAVHDAAAVIDDAALVIQASTAATGDMPVRPERRRKPRFPRLRHEARVHWKHIALYAPVVLIVVVLGALAIWSFIEKQSLIAIPDPLPKVTLITS